MPSQAEKDEKLRALNSICNDCIETYRKKGIPFDAGQCSYCRTGQEIHRLDDDTKWAEVDWNSSQWEGYYGR